MTKFWRNQGKAGQVVDAWAGGVARARVDGGLVLPGTNGNYGWTPDSAALSITGDIDIKVKVKMTDWTPAGLQHFVAKAQSTTARSYQFYVNTTGNLVLAFSADGSTSLSRTSTVATGFADGATKWVRVTLDVVNSTNNLCKFYTSDDGTTWTQLGTTITTAGNTSIADTVSPLEIGARALGVSEQLVGTVYRVIIQNAYDTADNTSNVVFDANFETQPDYTLSFTESSSNAATVTINQSNTSNDPLLLTPSSEGGVYLPGVSGNYLSVPDSAALSITGDIDIKVKVKMDDWTPAAEQTIVAKYGAAGQRSYSLNVQSNGTPRLVISTDGTAATALSATTATGFTDGATKWLRATLDVNDGAGNRVHKFYTSDDGTTWTQLGTTVTTSGTVSIFDSTAVLETGSIATGTQQLLTGTVYDVVIQSAYDTANNTDSLVCDINCDAITSHSQTTFTEQSSNAATVTINRSTSGRKTVVVPSTSKGGKRVWLFGTDDYLESPDNAALDVGASDSATMMVVHRHWNNFATNDALVAKKANTTNTTQGWFIGSGGVTTSTTGNGIVADGLKLTGVSGQFASSPDSAALSVTGDIDIKVKCAATDWTPSSTRRIVAKRSSNTAISYELLLNSTGSLVLLTSTDGTSSISTFSTVATGLTDGVTKWVRATMDANDGAGNRVAKFYLSDDGTTWTQLGSTVTDAGTTSIFDSNSALEIGSRNSGAADNFSGTVHRVIIQSAYDTANNTSSLVFDADFDAQEPDTITFKESSSNAAVVTVNGCYPFANAVQAQIGDGTDGMTRFTDARTAGQLSTTAFVINRANNTITPYLNGVARNTRNITDVGDLSNSEVLRIGRLSGAGTEYLDGEVYGVLMWKKALTATEISALSSFYTGRIP